MVDKPAGAPRGPASEPASRGRRIVVVVALVLACAALFLIPSAWLVARGQPRWLAAAAGLLAFPVAPVGWHLWAELRRRRAATRSSLTGSDRFLLRLVAVGLVAVGPLLLFRPGQVWRALRHHATWFVPGPGPAPLHGNPVLSAQVPADAEAIFWLRALDRVTPARGDRAGAGQPDQVLIGWRAGQMLIVVHGPGAVIDELARGVGELNKSLDKLPAWLPIAGPFTLQRPARDLGVVVTEGWADGVAARRAGGAGPAELLDRLARAPSDAVVIGAGKPGAPVDGLALGAGHVWLWVSEERGVRVELVIDTPDRATADALRDRLRALADRARAAAPDDCRKPVGKLLDQVRYQPGDAGLKLTAGWSGEQIGEAMMCAMAGAFAKR